jgi:hypothetical protein
VTRASAHPSSRGGLGAAGGQQHHGAAGLGRKHPRPLPPGASARMGLAAMAGSSLRVRGVGCTCGCDIRKGPCRLVPDAWELTPAPLCVPADSLCRTSPLRSTCRAPLGRPTSHVSAIADALALPSPAPPKHPAVYLTCGLAWLALACSRGGLSRTADLEGKERPKPLPSLPPRRAPSCRDAREPVWHRADRLWRHFHFWDRQRRG